MSEIKDPSHCNSKRFYGVVKRLTHLTSGPPRVVKLTDQKYENMSLDHALHTHLQDMYCEYERPGSNTVINACRNVRGSHRRVVTNDDMVKAFDKLARGKAVGIDDLSDDILHKMSKLEIEQEGSMEFFRKKAEEIMNADHWPKYLGEARIVPLSKNNSAFPKADEIRTIAVLPAWSKVIENLILLEMSPKLYGLEGVIEESQAGFRPGCGTEIQINRLFSLLTQTKSRLKRLSAAKVEPSKRPEYYAIFIDLRKAYDRVDRDLLLARMLELQFDPETINFCARWLSINAIRSQDKVTRTKVGVPQGGCLSPALFNIYVNSLLKKLKETTFGALAYADDIVLFVQGRS